MYIYIYHKYSLSSVGAEKFAIYTATISKTESTTVRIKTSHARRISTENHVEFKKRQNEKRQNSARLFSINIQSILFVSCINMV
jgi:uncharacterized membrane protein